jgi:tetratricopeptide (TPR) repeat protein
VLAGGLAARWRNGLFAAACLALAVASLDRLDSFSSGLKLWSDAVSKNTALRAPYVERAYIARGYIHLEARRLEAAAADFERALQLNPRSPDAHLARGALLMHGGRLNEALSHMDRAIALYPAYAAAYSKRCAARAGLGRPRDAIADCEQAVRLDPRNAEAWINRGVLYQRWLKRPAEAAASYQRALTVEPGSGVAHYSYGVLLLESGGSVEAARRHIGIGCTAGVEDACEALKRSRGER